MGTWGTQWSYHLLAAWAAYTTNQPTNSRNQKQNKPRRSEKLISHRFGSCPTNGAGFTISDGLSAY